MRKTILGLLALPLFLAACGTASAPEAKIDPKQEARVSAKQPGDAAMPNAPGACPTVGIVEDLRSMTMFADNETPDPKAILGYAKIEDFDGGCTFENGVSTIDLDVMFAGRLGGAAARQGRGIEPSVAFPYFIAVADETGTILNKEVFAVALRFREGMDSTHQAEHLRPRIPLPNPALAHRYQVLIGFQLNRAQLNFNRGE